MQEKKKIILFASVFDEKSLQFLEKFNPPAYKIASFESNHFPLIEKIIETKKPIIISTGLNSYEETTELVKFLKIKKCKNYALMKCTSSYPANFSDLNLKTIQDMRKKFKCEIGYSDHSIGVTAATSSIHYGATFIEKHICLDRQRGIDSKFSLPISQLKNFVLDIENTYKSIGSIRYGFTKNEKPYLKFKRSIYSSKNIKKGEKFTENNVKVIRPSFGLKPKFLKKIIGKTSKKNITFASAIKWKYIK